MKAFKFVSENSESVKKEIIINDIIEARNLFSRSFGLIFRKKLTDGQGLLIKKCKSIHTIGMRYRIDVVFLDKSNKVIAIYCNLRPFIFTPFLKDSFSVLEVKAGLIEKTTLKVTDTISFS